MSDTTDQAYTEEELTAMTKEDLKVAADDLGLDYASSATKGELVAQILDAQSQAEVGVEPLTSGQPGTSPIVDWRSWVAQQGGMYPAASVPATNPAPPAPAPGTPNSTYPWPLVIGDKILGANSVPLYDDTPTYRKSPDPYQGWTVQQMLAAPPVMVQQPFPPPVTLISRVNPTHGPASTAVNVQILGQGFTGATGATFGGTAATAFTVVNDTTITCTTPNNLAIGSWTVVVTNATTGHNTTTVQNLFDVP